MKRITLFLLVAVAAVLTGTAQSHVDRQRDAAITNVQMFELGGKRYSREQADSISRMLSEYYYDQFRSHQDPEAPYFQFLSRDGALSMGVGGMVRVRAWYDLGNVVRADAFVPYLIPMGRTETGRHRLGTSASHSALFFRVLGHNRLLGHYQVYAEGNFTGDDGVCFKLKKAYASFRGFTVGYAPSTFGDPLGYAPSIDPQGANNTISNSAVLVRYMHSFRGGMTVAASIEAKEPLVGADGTSTGRIDYSCPDVAAFVQYGWGPTSHVRLSGIMRRLGYRDLTEEKNRHEVGWGALLSATGHPADPLTLYGSVSYGKGYASLESDLSFGDYDLLDCPGRAGHMYAPAVLGYNVGVQYNFRPDVFASASFSQTRLYNEAGTVADQYKYGLWAGANLYWNITPRVQVGAEFVWGLRCDVDGYARSSRRFAAQCQFSF